MVTPLLGTLYALATLLFLFTVFLYSEKKGYSYARFFIFGFIYNCFTISLFYVFLPVPWLSGVFLQYGGMTLFILGGGAVSGLSFLVVPFLINLAKKKKFSNELFPLIIFISFITQDILRSLFISLFLLGEESSLGLHFILGSLGEALAFTPLVILAYKAGVFILTGFFAFLVFLLVSYFTRKLSFLVVTLYLAIFFCIVFAYQIRKSDGLSPITIGILTTNWENPRKDHTEKDFKDRANTINSLLSAYKGTIDLLILPESTSYLDARMLTENVALPEIKTYLDNTTIPKRDDYYTASLFYDTVSEITEERRKSVLMAFSEYDPYLYVALKKLFSVSSEALSKSEKAKDYHIFHLGKNSFASLICSEGTSLMPLLSFQEEAPAFYTLQSNLVVMKGRELGFMHLYAYTRIIAATTGKPVFSANNKAPSYGFDGKGKLLYSVPPSLNLHVMTLR